MAPDARVLVVDDNDMNRMVAIKLLRETRVQVDTVESGKECLKKTAEGSYHVILMDHMMPDMDGEETMRAVRAQSKGYCQKTPIIALTANVMTNAEQVYQDMGFDGYLAKPINSALLEACLLKYLPQELIEKYQIRLMYCYVHTREGRFCDLFEVSSDGMLSYLQQEGNYAYSSTAEPSAYEYFFADELQKAEQVVHITATTALSGAYPNAMQASRSFDNVTVVDSDHISSGHGLMVLYAAALAEAGKSVPEICRALEQFKETVCSNFLVPSTETLYRNGKVNGLVHKICAGLDLHPVLHMSQNKLGLWRIEAGNMQYVRRRYVKQILHHSEQIYRRIAFLTYAGCTVQQLNEVLEEVGKYVKFDKIVLQKASATVSSNCGVGVFGLMFIRKKEKG